MGNLVVWKVKSGDQGNSINKKTHVDLNQSRGSEIHHNYSWLPD